MRLVGLKKVCVESCEVWIFCRVGRGGGFDGLDMVAR